jgi:hypothetical protein
VVSNFGPRSAARSIFTRNPKSGEKQRENHGA